MDGKADAVLMGFVQGQPEEFLDSQEANQQGFFPWHQIKNMILEEERAILTAPPGQDEAAMPQPEESQPPPVTSLDLAEEQPMEEQAGPPWHALCC